MKKFKKKVKKTLKCNNAPIRTDRQDFQSAIKRIHFGLSSLGEDNGIGILGYENLAVQQNLQVHSLIYRRDGLKDNYCVSLTKLSGPMRARVIGFVWLPWSNQDTSADPWKKYTK